MAVVNAGVEATLTRRTNGSFEISYSFCFTLTAVPFPTDGQAVTVRRLDYTLVGADGVSYEPITDLFKDYKLGSPRVGCFFTYRDTNIVRPVAPSYRLDIEYSIDDVTPAAIRTATFTGPVHSSVPPQPYITGVTLEHNLPTTAFNSPRPVTFRAIVAGGSPPFLYQWRLNGYTLRDWDPDSSVTWDGATLGGVPITGVRSLTLAVSVRRSSWPTMESGASVNFFVQF